MATLLRQELHRDCGWDLPLRKALVSFVAPFDARPSTGKDALAAPAC